MSKIYIPLSTAQKYLVGADTVHAWAFKADPEIFGQFLIKAVSLSLVGAFIGAKLGYRKVCRLCRLSLMRYPTIDL